MKKNYYTRNLPLFVSKSEETGELFTIKQTAGRKKINFWYATSEHKYFYTFSQNEDYNTRTPWTEEVCRQLLQELKNENTVLEVSRYAVDDTYVFNTENDDSIVPDTPKSAEEYKKHVARMAALKKKNAHEKKNHSGPAPYILYGKHSDYGDTEKEFAWKLTPDKEKRQNIKPGDKVLVWTKFGTKEVTVTRIVEAVPGEEQPKCRVKRKL